MAATQDFLNTIGVNVHLGYFGTAYTDWSKATILQNLDYIDAGRVRDGVPNSPDWTVGPAYLANGGIKFDFLLPVYNGTADIPGYLKNVKDFLAAHPGSVAALEG